VPGNQGNQGAAGNQGNQGAQGSLGNQGNQGTTGIAPFTASFYLNSGVPGTNVVGDFAPVAESISSCMVFVLASDSSTDLTFNITMAGVSVFSSPPTVTHGTAGDTLVNKTSSLASPPISVAANAIFLLSVSSGTASWVFTVKLY